MTMGPITAAATEAEVAFADVALGNGVRLRYAHRGPATGPAIVLLHGYSDSSFSFSRIMPLLPPDRRVIAPDLRGHGDSDKPASGYRMADLAGDVIEMLDALDVPSAVIVGHSMGSFVAQALVEKAPRLVSGLVLLGSAPVAVNDTIKMLRSAVDELTDPVDIGFVRDFQYGSIAQPVPYAFMQTAIATSMRLPAAIWRQLIKGMMEYEPQMPRSSVRVLVIGGAQDSVFSVKEQAALAQQYPFARLRLFDDAGHSLHWEQPEAFVRALLAFVR
jgi:non-heme chloroperoxidase